MLIGLVAPAGAGKTVAAKHLRDAYGFKRLHAGRPIKRGFREAFGLSRADVDGNRKDTPNVKLGGKTPRDGLEAFGDGVHQKTPMATTIALRRRAMPHLSVGRNVVVDGVRSDREAAWIKKMGGTIIGVDSGTGVDPNKPLDRRQAGIATDHLIRAPQGKGRKKAIREGIDSVVNKMMAEDGTSSAAAE